jgi:hypothetical protein
LLDDASWRTYRRRRTRKVPGVVAVDVEGADDVEVELLAVDDAGEVEAEELLLGGVEPEAREVLLHLHGRRPGHDWCSFDDLCSRESSSRTLGCSALLWLACCTGARSVKRAWWCFAGSLAYIDRFKSRGF